MKNFTLAAMLLVGAQLRADAATVVVGNPNGPTLTKEQIAEIFVGKNMSLTPVDLPESSANRAEFYSKATGRELAQVKATWSRITFSGKGQPPKELADSAAVKKAVASDPKIIGYIDKSAVDGTVKVLLVLD